MSDKNPRKGKEEESEKTTTTTMARSLFSSNPISYRMDYKSREADELREAVGKKLFDFLGNYTDDVLADYIVVLVSNGKHQTQARDDLEDFLGEDSEKFVAWLWDYLSKSHIPRTTLDSSNLKAAVTRTRDDVSDNEHKSSNQPDIHTLCNSDGMANNQLAKDERHESSFCATKTDCSNAIEVSESLQRWSPSLNATEVNNKKLQTHLKEVSTERLSTKSMRVKNDSTAVQYSETTKQFSSIVRSSEIPSGDEQLHYEFERQKIAKIDSSAILHRPPPVGLAPREEQVARGLRSIVTGDHQSRPLPTRSSSKLRLQTASLDSAPHNAVRPRGNVWDRLGKPYNEDSAEMRGKINQHGDNLIKRESPNSQGKEFQNPRSMWINQHAPLSSNLVEEAAVLDNSCGKQNHSNGCRKLECSSNTIAISARLNNLKRKRLSNESDAGNSSTSFSGCKEIHLPVKELPQKNQGSLPSKFSRSQSLKESASVAKGSTTCVGHNTEANKVDSLISTGVERHSQTDKISSSQLNKNAVVINQTQELVLDKSQVVAKSESPIKSERLDANRKPVKEEVLDVKWRLRQIEMDMLKLRSKQAEMKNDAKPNALTGVQNHSTEDIESRTVLVTNVHFAASREALLSHFTKCGAVVKVVMLTDAITAQPKGASYIVFANKDSVEKAVSMSGTSFFSRILTVMRKADMPPDFLVPPQSTAKHMQPFHPQPYRKGPTQRPHTSTHLQWRRDNPDANTENSVSATTNGLESSST